MNLIVRFPKAGKDECFALQIKGGLVGIVLSQVLGRSGVNGLLVAEKDCAAMAGVLKKLAAVPAELERMGKGGLKLAEEKFNREYSSKKILEIVT